MKKVTIILVHYNNFDDTQNCIESVLQSKGVEISIVLVDNSEPNDERLNLIESNVTHLLRSDSNIGFGRGNNLGIEWAKRNSDFDFLFLLNNDALVTPKTIQQLTLPFKQYQDLGISTCKILFEHQRDRIWYGGGIIDRKKGWPKIIGYNRDAAFQESNISGFVEFVSGCAMMFSKESINKLKGFDEDFFMYCEDLELCMRSEKKGYKLYYSAHANVFHKVQGSIDGDKTKMEKYKGFHPKRPNVNYLFYHMKSNQYITMLKHLNKKEFNRFRIHFWMKFIYLNLLMLVYGKVSIISTSRKTFARIKELKQKIKK